MLSLPNLLLKYKGFSKISKCDKLIGLIKKFSISFPRNALIRIYKSFTRPSLSALCWYYLWLTKQCVIYNQNRKHLIKTLSYNNWSHSRNALGVPLSWTGIRIFNRCWTWKLVFLYEIVNVLSPKYMEFILRLNNLCILSSLFALMNGISWITWGKSQ